MHRVTTFSPSQVTPRIQEVPQRYVSRFKAANVLPADLPCWRWPHAVGHGPNYIVPADVLVSHTPVQAPCATAGTRKVKYLEENAAAVHIKLSAEEMEDLGNVFGFDGVVGDRYNERMQKATYHYGSHETVAAR